MCVSTHTPGTSAWSCPMTSARSGSMSVTTASQQLGTGAKSPDPVAQLPSEKGITLVL